MASGTSENQRGRRPRFVPSGWLPLIEAFERLGHAKYKQAWSGTELAARSEAEIGAQHEAEHRAALEATERFDIAKRVASTNLGFRIAPRPPRKRSPDKPTADLFEDDDVRTPEQ